jgi:hypothetical protein
MSVVCVLTLVTAVRLGPGPLNKGIFVRILRDGPGKGEEYQITHPEAQVNGILKGSYYGTMSDQISVTVRGGEGKTRLRVLIDYKDEVSETEKAGNLASFRHGSVPKGQQISCHRPTYTPCARCAL